jgi:hypothetical protein
MFTSMPIRQLEQNLQSLLREIYRETSWIAVMTTSVSFSRRHRSFRGWQVSQTEKEDRSISARSLSITSIHIEIKQPSAHLTEAIPKENYSRNISSRSPSPTRGRIATRAMIILNFRSYLRILRTSSPEEAVFYPSRRLTVSHDVYTGLVHRTRLESCGGTGVKLLRDVSQDAMRHLRSLLHVHPLCRPNSSK